MKKRILEIKSAYQIANESLNYNNITEGELNLLQYGTNITFSIIHSNEKFVIRISNDIEHYHRKIDNEVMFLQYLENLDDIDSCKIKYQQDGKAYLDVIFNDKKYFITYFKWISYPFINEILVDMDSYNAGVLLGKFHKYINRKEWDQKDIIIWEPDKLFSSSGIYDLNYIVGILSGEDADVFRLAISYLNKELSCMEKNDDSYGIIHGDFYFRNLYRMYDKLGLIDYETIGYGFYLMDMYIFEQTVNFIEEEFLRGYKTIRNIPEGYYKRKKMFHVFFCVRYLALIISVSEIESLSENEAKDRLLYDLMKMRLEYEN